MGSGEATKRNVEVPTVAQCIAKEFDCWVGVPERREQAVEALGIARQLDDPALLVRALTACCGTSAFEPGARSIVATRRSWQPRSGIPWARTLSIQPEPKARG